MIRRRPLLACAAALSLLVASACTTIDLTKALEVTDVSTGSYDDGVVKETGFNHIVPSISFRLRNKSDSPIYGVQLSLTFWIEGADGPLDEVLVRGIGSKSLAPGASTDPIVVRAPTGYSYEGARAVFFEDHRFKDAIAKVFAQRSGNLVAMGEFKLERHLIPHASPPGRP